MHKNAYALYEPVMSVNISKSTPPVDQTPNGWSYICCLAHLGMNEKQLFNKFVHIITITL